MKFHNISGSLARLVAVLSLLLGCSATIANAKPIRPHDVIRVDGEKQASIVFAQLIVNDEDDEVRGLKDKHIEATNNRLRKAGYRVPQYSASIFKEQELPDSDYMLAGTLIEIECIERFDVTCGLTVDWELLNRSTDAIVYRVTVRHEESKLAKMTEAERAEALLGGALDALLARRRFVDAVRVVTAEAVFEYDELVIKRCNSKAKAMPKSSEDALRATAVVKTRSGMGSAVFISPDGYLLTAAHVASEDEVDIVFMNGKIRRGELIRIDEARDVALLRLKNLDSSTECLELTPDSAKPGEDLYALGAPGGESLSFSISRGIVSGRRSFNGTSFLQTDASINEGNSGGPLLGADARVRAIASWKIGGEAVEGLGFGVPSSTAMNALKIEFGDESESRAPMARRVSSSGATVSDDPDPKWFYVGEDAPGRIPGWVRPVRTWGWVSLGTGATILTLLYANRNDSGYGHRGDRDWKIAGWTTAGIGLGMVISSYVWGRGKSPPQNGVAAKETVHVDPIVGPGTLGLRFTF